tara:strand:- start:113 stop:433 length:321 start_codon:yes stop_codon:yes gene_type:complete
MKLKLLTTLLLIFVLLSLASVVIKVEPKSCYLILFLFGYVFARSSDLKLPSEYLDRTDPHGISWILAGIIFSPIVYFILAIINKLVFGLFFDGWYSWNEICGGTCV